MSTFMHGLLVSLDACWREVDVLLNRAQAEEGSSNLEFHDVLCRASVVLIVAHLEGFIRDCARALVQDINQFSTFRQSPKSIKRTFCSRFITGEGAEINARVEKLIETFDGLDTKLTPDPFLFEGKNDDHKNPSPSVIQKISKNFGVKKIFTLFEDSKARHGIRRLGVGGCNSHD